MLALYSNSGFSAYAKYALITKKANPFFRHDVVDKEIDLIRFSGVSNLSEDFVKGGLLPIGRLACSSGNNELLSSVRYGKYGHTIRHIDCKNGKVLVCLRKQGNMPYLSNIIPNLAFIVCDTVSIQSKSGDNCLNLGGDDTCFTFHNFKLLNFPAEPIEEHQNLILKKLYGGNADIKNEDLIVDCHDAYGGCVLFRVEPYSFTFGDGRGNSGQALPKITRINIEEDNTLVLIDDSSEWKMNYGVRLVHNETRDIHEWRRTFSSFYAAYHHLITEIDIKKFEDFEARQNVWVWGGQTKTITELNVIDNR